MRIGSLKGSLASLVVCVGVAIGGQAHAGSANDVRVGQLIPGAAGFTFLTTGGTRSGAPACATLSTTWAIDVSTPQGQAMAASVITAFSTGRTMYIGGLDSCSTFQPNAETVFFLAINS